MCAVCHGVRADVTECTWGLEDNCAVGLTLPPLCGFLVEPTSGLDHKHFHLPSCLTSLVSVFKTFMCVEMK